MDITNDALADVVCDVTDWQVTVILTQTLICRV